MAKKTKRVYPDEFIKILKEQNIKLMFDMLPQKMQDDIFNEYLKEKGE